jgi:hypothetical protein
MVRMDTFICGLRDASILEDLEYDLLLYDDEGNVATNKFRGTYVIVDNCYLDWLCTVPLYNMTNQRDKIWWSKWMELMRKDVECTFGILKGRWCILKSGILIEGIDKVDKI